jgi:lysophospholipase L1-like esterase
MIGRIGVMCSVMTIRLAILGDSIAYGVGAAQPSDAIAPRLVIGLARFGVQAQTRVFAVPGAASAELAWQVQSATRWPPEVAVIIVGANDLTRLVPPDRAAAHLATAVRLPRSRRQEYQLLAPLLLDRRTLPATAQRLTSPRLQSGQIGSFSPASRSAFSDGQVLAAAIAAPTQRRHRG